MEGQFGNAGQLTRDLETKYQTAFIESVMAYNTAVITFPGNAAAFLWGCKPAEMIGQESLGEATRLDSEEEVNYDEFV